MYAIFKYLVSSQIQPNTNTTKNTKSYGYQSTLLIYDEFIIRLLSSLDYLKSIKRNPSLYLYRKPTFRKETKTDHFILSSLTEIFTIERIKIELGIIETSFRKKGKKKLLSETEKNHRHYWHEYLLCCLCMYLRLCNEMKRKCGRPHTNSIRSTICFVPFSFDNLP